ncbi:class II lanthipeptide, LchA2/BrtA2 family [Georgenia sp. Marseille-Q6866]
MFTTRDYTPANGYVSDAELVELTEDTVVDAAAGTTTVPCAIGGGVIAISAALPDFCPTGACTTRC